MASRRSRLLSIAGGLALAVLPVMSPAVMAHGNDKLTCDGGPIAAGTYESIKVTGTCMVADGNVTVRHDVVVKKGGVLLAAFGGSDLTINGDLKVEKDGAVALGCEPFAFTCLNDPAFFDETITPTLSAMGKVGHDLRARDALTVLVHNAWIGHDVKQTGGGGGLNCDSRPSLMGSPAYATYEDVTIGHNASITGFRSCWLGFFRNNVGHDVTFSNNKVLDPDGNEVATNVIKGDLRCKKNDPAPQVGDSGGAPNTVGHKASGQCAKLVW
jgi:hypothetical protein